jgi:hypothetical protein
MQPTCPTALQDERFLLLCSLGRGGMASVYRAFDGIEQRVVALKVLSERRLHGLAHPLAAEYEAWARLRHPNIVQAFELGVARRGPIPGGTPYLVLEHVEGPPLDRGLEPGRVAPEALEQLGRQLLAGLEHIHACGLVHRDVKPSNVLVTRRGGLPCYKLTDFGLAVTRGASDEPGRISGSLPYVAPESLLGRGVDTRADLYALGILLYQLATGRLPVVPGRVEDVLRWHLAGPPADPRGVRPRFPSRLARFIRRLTARDPAERPQDPTAALALLGDGLAPDRPASVPQGQDPSTRARLRLALDAVRLGASRAFPLASDWPGLAAQLRAWAHIFQLAFHDLNGVAEHAGPPLLRVVLQLLLESRDEAPGLVERFGLERCLPLSSVGGVQLADRARFDRTPHPEAARRIADFLLARAERRGLVLLAARASGTCGLTRRVVGTLARRLARTQPPRPGRRGLLLVLGPD